jgi:UDP-N-acetylglucosamine 2-epimerase (non-hydrolysing)
MIESNGLACDGVTLHDPIPYLEMLALARGARGDITDSRGLQEETSVLGVPCLTVRYNTDRPNTITLGTNRLVPLPDFLIDALAAARRPDGDPVIEGWDGGAGERVADALCSRLEPA